MDIQDIIKHVPSNIESISLVCRGLTHLPDLSKFTNLKYLDVSGNNLTSLPNLNENLLEFNCSFNELEYLPSLPKKLQTLVCCYNKLKTLPKLTCTLKTLLCNNNDIVYLPSFNNNLNILCLTNNNVSDIIYYKTNNLDIIYNINNIATINIKNTILNNFRYTFYLLKFKNKFKQWLWEKVREPKIMKKFHPDHLNELQENDDLEIFLEKWIKL
jgi:Leucine-rich repeat (LRR) protein